MDACMKSDPCLRGRRGALSRPMQASTNLALQRACRLQLGKAGFAPSQMRLQQLTLRGAEFVVQIVRQPCAGLVAIHGRTSVLWVGSKLVAITSAVFVVRCLRNKSSAWHSRDFTVLEPDAFKYTMTSRELFGMLEGLDLRTARWKKRYERATPAAVS